MYKQALEKWIQHPVYFVFWLLAGAGALFYIFHASEKEFSIQLSSMADQQEVVQQTEYAALGRLSNKEVLGVLERSQVRWAAKPRHAFAISPHEAEQILIRNRKRLPKRFKNNPMFQLLDQFREEQAKVDFEDPLLCNKSRQFYEKEIFSDSRLKDLLMPREDAPSNVAGKCFTHSMNSFEVPNMNYAFCAKATGSAKVPGAKPCVTSNLVNLTRNTFSDVSECLNLNPKTLFPKFDNESGFLLNIFSADKETGIGQLNTQMINDVNLQFDRYLSEVEKAAATKPACARMLRYRSFLTKASSDPEQRCTLIGVPENPLRNIFYTLLLNRMNRDQLTGVEYRAGEDENKDASEEAGLLKTYAVRAKLQKLGMNLPDMRYFREMLGLASYNMNLTTVMSILNEYLDKRIAAGLPLKADDFDFGTMRTEKDEVTGTEMPAVELARVYVMSNFISPQDTSDIKNLKVARRKLLPKFWALAYTRTFPEFLAYRANTYDGKDLKAFELFGVPGYLSLIAERNRALRETFENAELDPNLCSDSDFLKLKINLVN